MGPVFASSEALVTDVFLTPTKKRAKCRPRKKPAKTIRVLFSVTIRLCGFCALNAHSKPLALNMRQKANVSAGTSATCLITSEVELTEINAKKRIR